MHTPYFYPLTLCLILSSFIGSYSTFDDINEDHLANPKHQDGPLPKDKILLKSVEKLTFYRNRRTTSRRTHSIHQLSCVGGSAGCRLFTPEVVECLNTGFDKEKSKYNWKCHAEISDRVTFNHVEVICEGYDYPEDDYILLGSCGLEFTLDYKDSHDAHHQSYFHHMDTHEKEMHHERVRATAKPQATTSYHLLSYMRRLVSNIAEHIYLIATFTVFVICSILVVRYFACDNRESSKIGKKSITLRGSSYGQLTSAVLSTKKAC